MDRAAIVFMRVGEKISHFGATHIEQSLSVSPGIFFTHVSFGGWPDVRHPRQMEDLDFTKVGGQGLTPLCGLIPSFLYSTGSRRWLGKLTPLPVSKWSRVAATIRQATADAGGDDNRHRFPATIR
jgi:hypothetical protein